LFLFKIIQLDCFDSK